MENADITTENRVILFMDIHNYSIAARTAQNMYSFLQEMYETLGEIIVEHQGEIVKYMGDGILCVFPADAETEVVKCALDLRQVFADIVNRNNLPADTELEIGIGSGEVATGVFGHHSLKQRDVFGEEVNRAATIGHHRGIALTESVYEKIKRHYQTRPLPQFKVKWQAEPLNVWEVIE